MFGRYTPGRYIAKFTIVTVLGIFFGQWWVYNITCKPAVGWAVLFNGLLSLAVWSYLATALTDPGTFESPEWQAWMQLRNKRAFADEDSGSRSHGWMPGEVSWCRECGQERPERAHHCSQCGVCVLRMDHHCPWVGTCIGWRNHKYFVLLNWWVFLATLVFLLSLRHPYAIDAINVVGNLEQDINLLPTIGVLSALVFMFITGGMFAFSLSMLLRNVTAVEELFAGENPYRLPSNHDNLVQALGPMDLRILLPVEPYRRCNGTSFPALRYCARASEDTDAEVGASLSINPGSADADDVRQRLRTVEEQPAVQAVAGDSKYGSI